MGTSLASLPGLSPLLAHQPQHTSKTSKLHTVCGLSVYTPVVSRRVRVVQVEP